MKLSEVFDELDPELIDSLMNLDPEAQRLLTYTHTIDPKTGERVWGEEKEYPNAAWAKAAIKRAINFAASNAEANKKFEAEKQAGLAEAAQNTELNKEQIARAEQEAEERRINAIYREPKKVSEKVEEKQPAFVVKKGVTPVDEELEAKRKAWAQKKAEEQKKRDDLAAGSIAKKKEDEENIRKKIADELEENYGISADKFLDLFERAESAMFQVVEDADLLDDKAKASKLMSVLKLALGGIKSEKALKGAGNLSKFAKHTDLLDLSAKEFSKLYAMGCAANGIDIDRSGIVNSVEARNKSMTKQADDNATAKKKAAHQKALNERAKELEALTKAIKDSRTSVGDPYTEILDTKGSGTEVDPYMMAFKRYPGLDANTGRPLGTPTVYLAKQGFKRNHPSFDLFTGMKRYPDLKFEDYIKTGGSALRGRNSAGEVDDAMSFYVPGDPVGAIKGFYGFTDQDDVDPTKHDMGDDSKRGRYLRWIAESLTSANPDKEHPLEAISEIWNSKDPGAVAHKKMQDEDKFAELVRKAGTLDKLKKMWSPLSNVRSSNGTTRIVKASATDDDYIRNLWRNGYQVDKDTHVIQHVGEGLFPAEDAIQPTGTDLTATEEQKVGENFNKGEARRKAREEKLGIAGYSTTIESGSAGKGVGTRTVSYIKPKKISDAVSDENGRTIQEAVFTPGEEVKVGSRLTDAVRTRNSLRTSEDMANDRAEAANVMQLGSEAMKRIFPSMLSQEKVKDDVKGKRSLANMFANVPADVLAKADPKFIAAAESALSDSKKVKESYTLLQKNLGKLASYNPDALEDLVQKVAGIKDPTEQYTTAIMLAAAGAEGYDSALAAKHKEAAAKRKEKAANKSSNTTQPKNTEESKPNVVMGETLSEGEHVNPNRDYHADDVWNNEEGRYMSPDEVERKKAPKMKELYHRGDDQGSESESEKDTIGSIVNKTKLNKNVVSAVKPLNSFGL